MSDDTARLVIQFLLEVCRIPGDTSGISHPQDPRLSIARGFATVASRPGPEGWLLDAATWNQTPRVVQHVVMHLLTVTRPQDERIKPLEARLAALEARGPQHSRHADRPPSADPPWVTPQTPGGLRGTPGARPGHPGHRQALLEPTEVIEVQPSACVCGHRVCLDMRPC